MLHSSLNQLKNLLDSVAEGIFCVDLTGHCTFCNSRCLDLLGYESEEHLLQKNMHDLIQYYGRDGSVHKAEDSKIFQSFRDNRNVHVQDEVFFRRDGKRFDAEYWSRPIREGGQVVGAVITFHDISLRRTEANHRLHLARLVESSHDAILGRDLNGKIVSWNEGAKRIFGYTAEEALNRRVKDIILPPERDNEEDEIIKAIREGEELTQFEVKRRRKNGEVIDISLTISPVFNVDDELVGFSSIERDITENRKSQDAILRAMTAAEHAEDVANKANRSRADFLANVSHELRTPMNAILGMLNLAMEEKLEPTISDYLSVAKGSADSLLGLVNELLDFAKIESGNFEISREEFSLRETVDSAAKTLAPSASEKGLEILCEIDADVPVSVIGDGRRVHQVLTNLLSNATKFTEKGEVVVEVQLVRQLPSESRIRFAVRDTGIGIAEEDQGNILLPFQQADMSSTRQQHGTGLGLSICRELVSLMGGKLQLESKLGMGSKFWFELSLPISDGLTPADQLPTDLVRDLKVLIVDDNPTNLRILEKTFVSWSMQPVVTGDAEQALRVMDELNRKGQRISVVLVDCLMPRVDGFELAVELTNRQGEDCPPIVMMQSAADLALYSDRKSNAPVTQFLTKPISQSELLNTVVGVLDLYSQESQASSWNKILDNDASTPVSPLRILLVEDLPANQIVAKTILEKRGHTVLTANNGRNAIEHLSNDGKPFDVLLMDVQMPVMDGLQATAAIRAMENESVAKVPIIAMTAHAMQGDRESCLAAGMDAYLSKPLDAKHLIELTESIAGNSISADDGVTFRITNDGDGKVPIRESNDRKTREQHDENSPGELVLVEFESALQRLGNDKGLLAEFVEIFQSDSPELMEKISKAIHRGDPRLLEKSAHGLKGLMSNFGAKRCCELAASLEVAGRSGNMEDVQDDWMKLNENFERLCRELEMLRDKLRS